LNYLEGKFGYVRLTQYCSVDKIEKNEMGGACSALRVRAEVYRGLFWGNLRERYNLGDPRVDGKIILRLIFSKWDVGLQTESSWLAIGTCGENLRLC